MHFDLVDLRLIAHIADTGSMTGGAELSFISLSAASTRIKKLEEKIGIRLLYRASRGVTLTPAGQTLVTHARAVLNQLERMRGDMREYVSGIKGHVRIFANTTSLSEYLPRVLQHYLSLNPDVNIDLRERPSRDIVRAVVEGQADIGIVAGLVSTDDLETVPYRTDRLVLVAPRDHPLACRSEIEFVETLKFQHVGLHEGSAIHAFLQRACDQVGQPMQQRIQVGNFETACRMIEAGVGIGVIPESAAIRHAKTMKIVSVPLSDAWSVRQMLICMRSVAALPVFGRKLVQLLEADARSNFRSDFQQDATCCV